MIEEIKTFIRNDLGLKWDFRAFKTDEREFFMVSLTKIGEPISDFAKTLGLKSFETIYVKEFSNFWEANKNYTEILINWEEYAK